MKIIKHITLVFAACALLSGCYEDYVKDYDYSTIYCAFQYDLRTFVVGEGEKFDFTVGLAGVMQNTRDRKVTVELAQDLVTADLPTALGLTEYSPFTAWQGMLGQGKFGLLSQAYVTNEVKATGANALVPLPASHFEVSGLGDMCIKAGRHTDAVTIKATGAFLTDPDAIAPRYALAFRITSADADKLPVERSFEVIAVKYECKYFGYWYYGGERKVVDNITGKEVSVESYPFAIPQDDSKIYTLTTTGPSSVKTNKIGQKSGSIELLFSGDEIVASCSDPKVVMGHCYTNGAKAIQDRVIYLNYTYDNGDGTTSIVSDYLTFRNRIRDGISEWQDENPENYE
jgi:hypothetical protein